jgi:gas vesicle protein
MKKMLSFLAGAVLGGLLGGVGMLLLAPGSGSDSRKAIAYRFNTLKTELNNAVAEKRIMLEKEFQDLKKS